MFVQNPQPKPIPMVTPIVAFNLAPVWKDGDHYMGGILRFVNFTANTDTSIVHNLGKIPHFAKAMWVVDNGANPPGTAVYTPKLKASTITAWTVKTINIQSDTTCTACVVWIA